jgi:hypothetical protein
MCAVVASRRTRCLPSRRRVATARVILQVAHELVFRTSVDLRVPARHGVCRVSRGAGVLPQEARAPGAAGCRGLGQGVRRRCTCGACDCLDASSRAAADAAPVCPRD